MQLSVALVLSSNSSDSQKNSNNDGSVTYELTKSTHIKNTENPLESTLVELSVKIL